MPFKCLYFKIEELRKENASLTKENKELDADNVFKNEKYKTLAIEIEEM